MRGSDLITNHVRLLRRPMGRPHGSSDRRAFSVLDEPFFRHRLGGYVSALDRLVALGEFQVHLPCLPCPHFDSLRGRDGLAVAFPLGLEDVVIAFVFFERGRHEPSRGGGRLRALAIDDQGGIRRQMNDDRRARHPRSRRSWIVIERTGQGRIVRDRVGHDHGCRVAGVDG